VNILRPKQKRAILMNVSDYNRRKQVPQYQLEKRLSIRTVEKLFKMFPCVLSVKTQYADTASVQHATREMAVEI
jgi:hypothetical protein